MKLKEFLALPESELKSVRDLTINFDELNSPEPYGQLMAKLQQ